MKSTIVTSRRFVSGVVALVIMIFISVVPEFAEYEALMIEYISYIALALIAGYSLQDVAIAIFNGRTKLPEEAE